MKALELTVYPPLKRPRYGDQIEPYRKKFLAERKRGLAKRLTEAELAAEFEAARCDWMLTEATGSYWSPLGETWPHGKDAVSSRAQTLLRFAALPHYDESET